MEFRGTKGKWYADIRSGCCAVYPENRKEESNGISRYDDRNIYYSDKGAFYDKEYGYWTMDEESQANALLISKSPEMLKELQETIMDLKILKEQVSYESKIIHRWEGMDVLISDWIKRKENLIKEATEL